jgi:hypothetical protein
MKNVVFLVSVLACVALAERASSAESVSPRGCAHVAGLTSAFPATGAFATSARASTSTSAPDLIEVLDENGLTTDELAAARLRVCHISHHPLGRLHTFELACPLYFAEAEAVRPLAPSVASALTSSSFRAD